jgi:hypothetical protein
MARKTKNYRKPKSHRRKKSYRKTRKYRGGCNSNSCALSGSSPSATPLWTSKGGAHPEQISKDIYENVIDPSFYSSV